MHPNRLTAELATELASRKHLTSASFAERAPRACPAWVGVRTRCM
jgi:hypothetical protein